ncbi:MAG: tRNA uridine(34) 5-carboxymethylaminomethyl modification radical SAM/GNAT enzyme Elp3 [Candidatus Lokiarchaeota archaeon]|nr:tRNA uridine(34) 5-carboxymethylaminomethyl modification radical SAM/GNAT enzyme Elp3 [Candidatus Lokiarchaeota archaeon]MBD3199312.1 tRNA uridine(34) 5-carboxymethylaminomethyl modification radical SAM/GNAT enzyme Elp3 [Candidatus Lokiarchaeota archaeon]
MNHQHEKIQEQEKIEFIARETIRYLLDNPHTPRKKITNIKGRFAKKFNYDGVIKNATVLEYMDQIHLSKKQRRLLNRQLKRRSTRSISGVSVIAIMSKPLKCPGNCIYCPGNESQPEEKVAQSYTGREPAAMRSIHYNYDPFSQVRSRIEDLEAIGHKVDKIELILMGGTILSADLEYQESFVKGALEGVINEKVESLSIAKKKAESSKRRVIGITMETRPDYCKEIHVDRMLNYGTTRVEIGIQTVFDEVYSKIKRGHTVKDSKEAIRIAKDAGLKVNAHMMPNLPGSSLEKDHEMFRTLFANPEFRPDMLKIYPCLVIKGTELYNLWMNNKYEPYDLDTLVNLLVSIKQEIPQYVRIQRIMRDIPAPLIETGCQKSNLRQIVQQKLKNNYLRCNCIRCREFGIKKRKLKIEPSSLNNVKLYRKNYEASQGEEIFLSYENKEENYLVGYLRLRKPSNYAHRLELNDGKTLIIREIKVVGELVPKNLKPHDLLQIQHRGFGTALLKEAERISREEYNSHKISVISGIGVRKWFYKLGYCLDGPYVSKKIG